MYFSGPSSQSSVPEAFAGVLSVVQGVQEVHGVQLVNNTVTRGVSTLHSTTTTHQTGSSKPAFQIPTSHNLQVLTSGNQILTSGNQILTSGNQILTSGNQILTSGNQVFTSITPVTQVGNGGKNLLPVSLVSSVNITRLLDTVGPPGTKIGPLGTTIGIAGTNSRFVGTGGSTGLTTVYTTLPLYPHLLQPVQGVHGVQDKCTVLGVQGVHGVLEKQAENYAIVDLSSRKARDDPGSAFTR